MEHNNNNSNRPKRNTSKPAPRSGRPERNTRPERNSRPEKEGRTPRSSRSGDEKPFAKPRRKPDTPRTEQTDKKPRARKPMQRKPKTPPPTPKAYDGTIRLNKYIANAGICSRREADKLIAAGSVMVNGTVVTEMGFQVHEGDVVNYGGEVLRSERKRYFLLNKPKGYITTVDDPQERKTVMMLIDSALSASTPSAVSTATPRVSSSSPTTETWRAVSPTPPPECIKSTMWKWTAPSPATT